jgi:biopolymer transport protein ExbD
MIPRRRRRLPTEDPKTEAISMTPMIDVVFQLLIFFMLSMHFKEVEGKLISQLPKEKGPRSSAPIDPQLLEVRVVLCAGGDLRAHRQDKGGHEAAKKDGSVCFVLVDQHEIGRLRPNETAKAANAPVYVALAARAKELWNAQPLDAKKRVTPVIVDADSEVPYEHVIGTVNALKAAGIDAIEFTANPRFLKYAR